MEITLKNIKHAAFASQETHCFSASVYLDGKPFCTVENSGHGGGDNFHPLKGSNNSELYAKIKEINAELGEEMLLCDGFEISNDIEIVIGDLVNDWLKMKEVKKSLKKICYTDGKDIYTVAAKYKPTKENLVGIQQSKWWKPEYVLLNDLPLETAAGYFH